MTDADAAAFEIERLEPKPGDFIVVRLKHRAPPEVMGHMLDVLRSNLPDGVKGVVVEGDVDVDIVRVAGKPGEALNAAWPG